MNDVEKLKIRTPLLDEQHEKRDVTNFNLKPLGVRRWKVLS